MTAPNARESRLPRRTAAETLFLHLLLHVGYSKALLSEAPIRSEARAFGKHPVERAAAQIKGRFAHQIHKWPIRPLSRAPGKSITSNRSLTEMSLIAASMYYLYKERIYEELCINEVNHAYDLYTNMSAAAGSISQRVSPDTAWWLAREFVSHTACVPLCPKCKIRFYSSADQLIKNACPFCKSVGIGDVFAPPKPPARAPVPARQRATAVQSAWQ